MAKISTRRRNLLVWLLSLVTLSGLTLWLITPWGQSLEEGTGLDVLFHLRGERAAPRSLAVVAITENTAEKLGLPESMVDWPRTVYAQLVRELSALQVRVIVFDIFFKEQGDPQADQAFANALRQAQNVILFAFTRRKITAFDTGQIMVDRIAEPLPLLQQSAVSTAPFMLPKVFSKVTRFWIRWAGYPPRWTLPAAALLQQSGRSAEIGAELAALADVQVYNYYGPPHSIATLPLEDLLREPQQFRRQLADAVVFIGYSPHHQPGQKDGFYTPFTEPSGLDISGVELAATGYANLLERSVINYDPFLWLVVQLFYGVLILLAGLRLPQGLGLAAILALALAYGLTAYLLFARAFYWLPLVTPLLVLTPLVALISAWRHVILVGEQKQRLEKAFGRYLPAAEIRRLASHPERFAQRETLFGVCLVTDAEGYTSISEKLGPQRLSQVMEQYYAAVITPIRRHGGIISDVAGDGVIAIWPHVAPNRVWATISPALQALQASVEGFNRGHPENPLPTRVGVHAGDVVMGHFGASDHFEYRAIGDLVNTTSRIENANKSLGVRALLSEVCVTAGNDRLRCLGKFLLQGKRRPITLFSPLEPPWDRQRENRFRTALQQLGAGQRAAATDILTALLQDTGDPVCEFYLHHSAAGAPLRHQRAGADYVVALGKS